ncbi:MAG: hypothetical protein ABA06_00075 [Parcubacteria bacterium C7867-001]|nr:MAG: hypothetical protein ABA06_00075 [Parcubacteria bacterium C7867-001]
MIRGIILLEVILYIALATIVIGAGALLYITILAGDSREEAPLVVEQSASAALDELVRIVRTAMSINTPADGVTGTTVLLTDAGGREVAIALEDGVLTMSKGGESAVRLTHESVIITNLAFENRSGSLVISFDAAYANAGGRPEFEYAKQYETAVTPRPFLP